MHTTELSRERFAFCVTDATVEGSMHLHAILGSLVERLKEMQSQLVACQPSKVTAVDKLHGCNLADLVVESLINDMPVDAEDLLAGVDPEDSLGIDCERAIECVKRGLLETVKGFHNHASPLIQA